MSIKKRIVVVTQTIENHTAAGGKTTQQALVEFNKSLPQVLPVDLNNMLNAQGKLRFTGRGFVLKDEVLDPYEVTKLSHQLARMSIIHRDL